MRSAAACRVYTTIDLKKQKEARAAIANVMGNVGPSSAIVTINPGQRRHRRDGVPGREYGKSKFNLAAQGHRQPGSSFKWSVLTALREGVDPNSTTYVSQIAHEEDRLARGCGAPVGGQDLRRHRRRQHEPACARRCASDNSVYTQLDRPTSARTRSRRPRG